MFGANAFGWPYLGQAYAGTTTTGGGVTITLSASASLTFSSAGGSLTIFPTGSGTLSYQADDAQTWPAQLSAELDLTADAPTLPGITTVPSGRLAFTGTAPLLPATLSPSAGQVKLSATGPSSQPSATTAGLVRFVAAQPTSVPATPSSGVERMVAATPTVYPVQPTSGVLNLNSDGASFATSTVYLSDGGKLILASTVPTITPLTAPPQPTTPGATGIHMAVVV